MADVGKAARAPLLVRLRRIVLSFCFLLCFAACENLNGIGTSPSLDDDPLDELGEPLAAPPSCGLWWSPESLSAAEARHDAAPGQPDIRQDPLPGGLACTALIVSVPAIESHYGGHAVVRYVAVP